MLIQQRMERFVRREGRRPRILVCRMGPANHNHDTKQLATFFAESGFDVDISPPNQTPWGIVRMAIENDDHAICFLIAENKHKSLIVDLAKALKAAHAEKVRIVMGGNVPRSDFKFLYGAGVDLILNSLPADRAAINQLLDLFQHRA